jgi:Tfp pilus assembly protein PilN
VSQVNLLPPDILQAQRYRRTTSLVILGGIVLLVLIFGFYLLQANRLGGVNDEIAAQNANNASIQASIAEKQKFADLQARAQAKQQLLASAYAGETSFSALLMDFSRVIPSDAFVDSLALQVSEPTTEPAEGVVASLIGTITGSGTAKTVDSLSVFLTRLEQVKGWVNPWMSTVSQNPELAGYDYSLSVDLTDDVVTDRGRGGTSDAAG